MLSLLHALGERAYPDFSGANSGVLHPVAADLQRVCRSFWRMPDGDCGEIFVEGRAYGNIPGYLRPKGSGMPARPQNPVCDFHPSTGSVATSPLQRHPMQELAIHLPQYSALAAIPPQQAICLAFSSVIAANAASYSCPISFWNNPISIGISSAPGVADTLPAGVQCGNLALSRRHHDVTVFPLASTPGGRSSPRKRQGEAECPGSF